MTLAEACAIFILTPLTVAVFKYAKPPEQPQVVAEAVQPPDASPEPVATPEPTPTQQEPAETVEEAPASETHAECNAMSIGCTAYRLSREAGVSEEQADAFLNSDEYDLEVIADQMCASLHNTADDLQDAKDRLSAPTASPAERVILQDAMLAASLGHVCPEERGYMRMKLQPDYGK